MTEEILKLIDDRILDILRTSTDAAICQYRMEELIWLKEKICKLEGTK